MPRKPREIQVGNIYHLINRGVEKRTIFRKDQDYSRFILALEFFNDQNPIGLWNLIERFTPSDLHKRLERSREKPKDRLVDLLAFALMPNHYHLVAQEITPNGISLFMQKLGGYASYFNKQYDRVGSLFQSRFKSVLIKDDTQLYTIFAYVHTNPVELVEPGWKEFEVQNTSHALQYLQEYRWSSYLDYIGKPNFPMVSQRERFLNFYGDEKKCQDAVEDWVKYKAKKTKIHSKHFE
jgi:putative transposase